MSRHVMYLFVFVTIILVVACDDDSSNDNLNNINANVGHCGNGYIELNYGEECEIINGILHSPYTDSECDERGYAGGNMNCTQDCKLDESECIPCASTETDCYDNLDNDCNGDTDCRDYLCEDLPICNIEDCGNGSIDYGESCDGVALGGYTCEDFGFLGGGTLQCDENCMYDTSACIAVFACFITQSGCSNYDLVNCVCKGCSSGVECGQNIDCVCPGCLNETQYCTQSCVRDGYCYPYLEGCGCVDCEQHPLCL